MRGDAFFVEVAKQPPFTRLHPRVASFFRDYFREEKVVRFRDRFVVNTHFPPYPSRAFENLVEGFGQLGNADEGRLYSVALAVTNRCTFDCWHCYNAGRSQVDLPIGTLRDLAAQLQDRGAVMVTLTGGEPLLRDDLEEIAGAFDERTCLIVGTTGDGLTPARSARLCEAGVFGVGISLDSIHEAEHDRLRGRTGAFQTALQALRVARENGLYAYVVAVATHEFLRPENFLSFMQFAGDAGALEVHLLEPSATGKLAGRTDVLLSNAERRKMFDYQGQIAARDDLPILSTYGYLESPQAFGCGAGLTHLYIDGSGEVCPCQLVPLSFGNISGEPLEPILDRMGRHFCRPRAGCVGRLLAAQVADRAVPTPPEESEAICEQCVPRAHALPRFFQVQSEARDEVGQAELQRAYDDVHGDYDEFWLSEAAKPIDELVNKLRCRGDERVFEAGCGTGYATVQLAKVAKTVLAADLSEGMLANARRRVDGAGLENVQFVAGDALQLLSAGDPFDLVFSSWVLGYIPLAPFFAAVGDALVRDGRVALIVHKENSPREPLEIFAELVARDPTVLQKRVAFDFPRDGEHLWAEAAAAGFVIDDLTEGEVTFRYAGAEDVLEHLLKSGAGTAFYEAIDPDRRAALTSEFLKLLSGHRRHAAGYEVKHEYIACVARKTR